MYSSNFSIPSYNFKPQIIDFWTFSLNSYLITNAKVLSLLFSLYVENAANYSVIYGSIGAIIVLLLWLYLSATMMIMGAEFNSVLMEMKTARG